MANVAPSQIIVCDDETAMQVLGHKLLLQMSCGGIITLTGELGAGKSVLARAIIHAAGFKGRVKSPTYTLVESYAIEKPVNAIRRIAHLDLYRLADPEELHYLGFDDVLTDHDLALIEWPERAGSQYFKATLHICIEYLDTGGRKVLIDSAP